MHKNYIKKIIGKEIKKTCNKNREKCRMSKKEELIVCE